MLRCVWTINISLADWKFVNKQYVITGTAILEALRYFIFYHMKFEMNGKIKTLFFSNS